MRLKDGAGHEAATLKAMLRLLQQQQNALYNVPLRFVIVLPAPRYAKWRSLIHHHD
jgi:hypothetical protein